jgi:hypothetical protein
MDPGASLLELSCFLRPRTFAAQGCAPCSASSRPAASCLRWGYLLLLLFPWELALIVSPVAYWQQRCTVPRWGQCLCFGLFRPGTRGTENLAGPSLLLPPGALTPPIPSTGQLLPSFAC